MKTKVISILLLLLIVSTISYAQQYRKYPFRSGKVEYKMDGNTTGTSTLIWDDYGYKEFNVENSVSTMFGQTTTSNDYSLMIGSEMYEWSNNDENVYQLSNPMAQKWEDGDYDEDDVEAFSIEMLEALGFEKIGTETVLGKKCDVYKGLGKVWVWKGISLKTEVKILGTISTITATKIETNIRIPSSSFELPQNRELIVNVNIDQHAEDEMDESIEIKTDEINDALKNLFGGN
ncbi:MAG: hypothetical protein PF541_09950 [Prolixibacteraceae bacterium]|jgi:hypothetical protein|nr:hypothetical protein [Prolixibacteraceae bacterium]